MNRGPAWDAIYGPHMEELERAMMAAIRDAADRYDATPDDEFYILGISCDGQYVDVTVGVSNVADHNVQVNADTGEVVRRYEDNG